MTAKNLIKSEMHKICIPLYGKPPGTDCDHLVSGLAIWQKKYLKRLKDLGFIIVEIYFEWSGYLKVEKVQENRYVLHLDEKNRVFHLEFEAIQSGLNYHAEAKFIEAKLLEIFKFENVEAIIMINWISCGMIMWQACLNFGKPVIFIPTEHSSICHLGFLLNPNGSSCSGPNGGIKCSNCTHGLEPISKPMPTSQPMYSKRFLLFYQMTKWLSTDLQKLVIWNLSELFLPKLALLSEKQGYARLESVKRFLQDKNIFVMFQSQHQHQLFERATNVRIPIRSSLIIPANRNMVYKVEKDQRILNLGKGKIVFLFAGRASFDRGLHFLLGTWLNLTQHKSMIKLIIRCDDAGKIIEKQVTELKEKGFDVDMSYGRLEDEEFIEIHRQVNFIINPSLWEEPLSGSVIESFDLGTPAIVPTNTGSACFVKTGNNGYLFEFRNKVSFLSCIENAIINIHNWESLHRGALQVSADYQRQTIIQLAHVKSIVKGESYNLHN